MRELLTPASAPLIGSIITVLFLAAFVGLCLFVFSKGRRATYQRLERLPIEEDR